MVFSVPVAQQSMMIMMNFFSRSSVCFSLCLRMHLRTSKIPKISWGNHTPRPPTLNSCRVAMFSTSANDIAPPDRKLCTALITPNSESYFWKLTFGRHVQRTYRQCVLSDVLTNVFRWWKKHSEDICCWQGDWPCTSCSPSQSRYTWVCSLKCYFTNLHCQENGDSKSILSFILQGS